MPIPVEALKCSNWNGALSWWEYDFLCSTFDLLILMAGIEHHPVRDIGGADKMKIFHYHHPIVHKLYSALI